MRSLRRLLHRTSTWRSVEPPAGAAVEQFPVVPGVDRVVRTGVGEDAQGAGLVGGGEQLGERGAREQGVTEHGLGGRARVPDGVVVVDDEDDVRGVVDERPEVGLARPAVDLLREPEAFQGEGRLGGERLGGARDLGELLLGSREEQHAEHRFASGRRLELQGAEQRVGLGRRLGGDGGVEPGHGEEPGTVGDELGPGRRGRERQPVGTTAPRVGHGGHGREAALAVTGEEEDPVIGAGTEERRGGRLHRSGDLPGAQGGDEGGGGDPEAALARLGLPVSGHHAPQSGEDQQEHQRREDRDDADVLVLVEAQRLEEEQGGGDEGGAA